uniref:Uncharacterized protein n=1 Tax=Oryza sativa subsp. japonica TaxID=39947 RepID=Q654V0_ORYSJ|nr:hypothetical protein [Oryza sativa Japonica Group]
MEERREAVAAEVAYARPGAPRLDPRSRHANSPTGSAAACCEACRLVAAKELNLRLRPLAVWAFNSYD